MDDAVATAQSVESSGAVISKGAGKKKKNRDMLPESVNNLKPRYLPNLKELSLSKRHIDMGRIAISVLDAQLYRHDAAAAEILQEEKCVVFEVPREMFPRQAPLNKITYLPHQLLPSGFDAAGVFPLGVLARKFYPTGLLQLGHTGPTPPLFVGRRIEKQRPAKDLLSLLTQVDEHVKVDDEAEDEVNEISVGFNMTSMESLAKDKPFAHYPEQYDIYIPDLSMVPILVPVKTKFCMTLLCDVVHPHQPKVADAILNENIPSFELPEELSPMDGSPMSRPAVFLPERYLPPGFEAGCVFGRNTLPQSRCFRHLRKAQPRNMEETPALFFGLWKNNITPSIFLLPSSSCFLKMVSRLAELQDASASNPDKQLTDEKLLLGDMGPVKSDKKSLQRKQIPDGDEKKYQLDEEQESEKFVDDGPNGELLEVKENKKLFEEFKNEEPLKFNDEESSEDKKNRNPGLCFFTLTGHPDSMDSAVQKLENAGVKLASSYFDQNTIKKAWEQWIDLVDQRDEIRANMLQTGIGRPYRNRRRRCQPENGCDHCGNPTH